MKTERLPWTEGCDGDLWVHCTCKPCGGTVAFCGLDTANEAWVDGEDVPLGRVCPLCRLVLEEFLGCPKGCPL